MISKVYQVSDEEFREIVKQADSYSDCLRALGLNTKGGSSTDILKRRIKELDCDISHFNRSHKRVPGMSIPLEEILVENSTYTSTWNLKKRLLKAGLLEYKCAICGLTNWMGRDISLQLDHINGNNTDNRLENLRFLCPNCHSQTDTYAGKNQKIGIKGKNYCVDCGKEITQLATRCRSCALKLRVVPIDEMKVTREELKSLIRTTSFLQIGRKYNVSDNAIRKWCKKLNLPSSSAEIKKYNDKEWELI